MAISEVKHTTLGVALRLTGAIPEESERAARSAYVAVSAIESALLYATKVITDFVAQHRLETTIAARAAISIVEAAYRTGALLVASAIAKPPLLTAAQYAYSSAVVSLITALIEAAQTSAGLDVTRFVSLLHRGNPKSLRFITAEKYKN